MYTVSGLLYNLTSSKIRIIKILKENCYWSPVCLALSYACFLFFGSKQYSASIFTADTGSLKLNDSFIYVNDM